MLCLCFRNVCSSSLKSSRASFRRLSRLWERMSSWAALPHAWCQAVSSLNFRTRAAASSLIRLVGGKFLAQRNKTFHAILTQKSKNDQVDINVVKWENSSLPFFSNHNKVLSAKVKCIIFFINHKRCSFIFVFPGKSTLLCQTGGACTPPSDDSNHHGHHPCSDDQSKYASYHTPDFSWLVTSRNVAKVCRSIILALVKTE